MICYRFYKHHSSNLSFSSINILDFFLYNFFSPEVSIILNIEDATINP